MHAVEFEGQTNILGAPSDTPKDKCKSLPVKIAISTIWPGLHTFTSYWKPTQAEIDFLVAGGCMEVTIHSSLHPPMAVHACPPLTTVEDKNVKKVAKKSSAKDNKEISTDINFNS